MRRRYPTGTFALSFKRFRRRPYVETIFQRLLMVTIRPGRLWYFWIAYLLDYKYFCMESGAE